MSRRLQVPNRLRGTTVDFSPDSRMLVLGQRGDAASGIALALWSLQDERPVSTLIRGEGAISRMARFSPEGNLVAYVDADPERKLALHDLHSRKTEHPPDATFVSWLCFAPDADRLMCGGRQTQVWDLTARKVLWTMPVDARPARADIKPPACALMPGGHGVVASGLERGRIVVLEIPSGNKVAELGGAMDAARSLTIDARGRYVAAISDDGRAAAWDLQTGDRILADILDMRQPYYWCVRFHPDGEHIGLGLWSGFVNVIRISDGEYALRQDVPPHKGIVQDIAISPDGRRLCSVGDDGAVLLWEI